MKSSRRSWKILEGFELTGSLRDATELADVCRARWSGYVADREAGTPVPGWVARSTERIDEFLTKLESCHAVGHNRTERVPAIDATRRIVGGVATYLLTDNDKTVTVEHVAGYGTAANTGYAPATINRRLAAVWRCSRFVRCAIPRCADQCGGLLGHVARPSRDLGCRCGSLGDCSGLTRRSPRRCGNPSPCGTGDRRAAAVVRVVLGRGSGLMAAGVDVARRWGPKLRSTCTPALPRTPAGWGCTGSRLASAHRELADRDRHGVNFRTGAPLSPTERRVRVLAVPGYLVPDLGWWLTTALTPARTGSPATRCSWPAPPGCASASWSTSNPPACTRFRPGGLAEVPLGKVAAGRMVPVDEQTVVLIDWICVHRSSGRPFAAPENRTAHRVPAHSPRPLGERLPATRCAHPSYPKHRIAPHHPTAATYLRRCPASEQSGCIG